MDNMQPDTLQAAVESLGLEYVAEFVPFSKSRNAKPAPKPSEYSLNWRITISKGARSISTDYQQGIGHIPGFKSPRFWTVDQFDALKFACEHGRTAGKAGSVISMGLGSKPIPAPLLRDVLYSLVLDTEAIEFATFEDWADCYGLDKDSRKAEQDYQSCLKLALQLRALIGDENVSKLREAARGY